MARSLKIKLSSLVLLPVLLIPVACLVIYLFADAEKHGLIHPISLAPENPVQMSPAFEAYWQDGLAEVTSYHLDQARYGEMHSGTAVLMFMAQDFSIHELTKSDGTNGPKLPVLQVSLEKKFVTGIYPYSMLMTAVSSIDVANHPLPLKVSTSCQDWSGSTYAQLNFDNGDYALTEHSYFSGEGDQEKTLNGALPEDAIWTRLRIAPDQLPMGNFRLIPSTFYARLRHKHLEVVKATASRPASDSTGLKIYQIDYADGSRQLKIWYAEKFPYDIVQWEENYEEGWGPDAKRYTTKALRMHTKKLAYWDLHRNADQGVREEMGL